MLEIYTLISQHISSPTDRPTRFKNTTLEYILLLGWCGGHRFYLRQPSAAVWSAIGALTGIPLLISVFDFFYFLAMPAEKFDERYNTGKWRNCPACKAKLTITNTPMFGWGKLSDGERLCHSCERRLYHYYSVLGRSVPKLNSTQARRKLPCKPRPISAPQDFHYGYKYHHKLLELSKELTNFLYVLAADKKTKSFVGPEVSTPLVDLLLVAIGQDLIALTQHYLGEKFAPDKIETIGFHLLQDALFGDSGCHYLPRQYRNLVVLMQKQPFWERAREVHKAVSESKIVHVAHQNPDTDIQAFINDFPVLSMLQLSENRLCQEYTKLLLQYSEYLADELKHWQGEKSALLHQSLQLRLTSQNFHHPNVSPPTSLPVEKPDTDSTETSVPQGAIEELTQLIGLDSVKQQVQSLANYLQIQQERSKQGLKAPRPSYHLVFTGNPGTGKTTVARIVAKIYHELGLLSKGQLVETDRSGMIAGFVGQTAAKVNRVIDTAIGGVLFIDEAYALITDTQQDYGHEAVATLLKRMEDQRDDLVVILAGYPTEMRTFINSNPGLESRFNRYINFPDYEAEDLLAIFQKLCADHQYKLSGNALQQLTKLLKQAYASKQKGFGNGRFVRNLFEQVIQKQADRLSAIGDYSVGQLMLLEAVDFD